MQLSFCLFYFYCLGRCIYFLKYVEMIPSLVLSIAVYSMAFHVDFMIMISAYLYIICAVHHNRSVLLTVHVRPRLPQLFGLAPLPLSRLCV